MTQLFRVLYCSRNTIGADAVGMAAHVRSILDVSRRNNARDGLTGGLLFSAGCFAQVLEGPPEAVERAFERIQCDDRHADVTVIEAGPVAEREFSGWSMAFNDTEGLPADPFAAVTLDAAFNGQSDAGNALLNIMRGIVNRDTAAHPVWPHESRPSPADGTLVPARGIEPRTY